VENSNTNTLEPDDFEKNSTWPVEEVNFPDLSVISFDSENMPPLSVEPQTSLPEVVVKQEFTQDNLKKRTPTRKHAIRSNKKPKLEDYLLIKEEKKAIPHIKGEVVDDKYKKRLVANKRSAQASRERKKQLKVELEQVVDKYVEENGTLATQITELQTENKVLKAEFVQLQRLITESAVLSKLMARANMTFLPPTNVDPNVQPTSTQQAAAMWYLMIVLYSFNQYFTPAPSSYPTNFAFSTAPSVFSVA